MSYRHHPCHSWNGFDAVVPACRPADNKRVQRKRTLDCRQCQQTNRRMAHMCLCLYLYRYQYHRITRLPCTYLYRYLYHSPYKAVLSNAFQPILRTFRIWLRIKIGLTVSIVGVRCAWSSFDALTISQYLDLNLKSKPKLINRTNNLLQFHHLASPQDASSNAVWAQERARPGGEDSACLHVSSCTCVFSPGTRQENKLQTSSQVQIK